MSIRLHMCALLCCSAWLHFAACGLVGVATAYAYVWIAQVGAPAIYLPGCRASLRSASLLRLLALASPPRRACKLLCCNECPLPLPPAPRRSTTLTTTMNLSR